MRVVGYSRVSTREQAENGAGLEGQRQVIARECEYRGYELVEAFVDAGVSGKNTKRPALQDALALLERGEADTLMSSKLDRLTRSTRDFYELLELSKRQGWQIVVLDVGMDTSTPMGKAMAGMVAVFAELERDRIGERTRDGLAVKRAQGVKLGRPVSMPANVVARIVEERAAGQSCGAIAEGLNVGKVATAQGGKRWYASTVRAVLARAT